MRSLLFFSALFSFLLSACGYEQSVPAGKNLFALSGESGAYTQIENLRLYPVVITEKSGMPSLSGMKTLAEAMQTPGFRILERKQFGRTEEPWYSGLTVQNKTQDTVLMLAGEVVKGGNQDRVLAHHEVIMPMSVRNIEVFCVEAGRSQYFDPAAPAAEKELAAFSGYFSIASPKVRLAANNGGGNQQAVWDAVDDVTKANNASSETKAYTALDQDGAKKAEREAACKQFAGATTGIQDMVGVVAVCGDQVIGVDIFGSPALFQKQRDALLHGYLAEAALHPTSDRQLAQETLNRVLFRAENSLKPNREQSEDMKKFEWKGNWIHLFGH